MSSEQKKISIIGAGSWGTTVSKLIGENNPDITINIWAYEKNVVKTINQNHENQQYLPGVSLPINLVANNNLKDCAGDSTLLILATPSKVIFDISQKISKIIHDEVVIGYLTKGFCKIGAEILTISEALSIAFPHHRDRIVAISGPSHAEEVSNGFHTCLNLGSLSQESAHNIMELLSSDFLTCRITTDVKGVELGGTLKNPAAIAAGILSMLPNCGDNLAGALISESFKEILKVGRACGAKDETLIDISGLGDLITTALSNHSRNRRFGIDIAKQIMKKAHSVKFTDRIRMRIRPENVLKKMSKKMQYLAEGAYAIEPLLELAEIKDISIPVYRSLYEILLNKKSPELLIETVKHPEKFDELYRKTKIHVSTRKKGMEKTKGFVFKNLIVANTVATLSHDPDLKKKLFGFKDSLLHRLKKRDSRNNPSILSRFDNYEISLYKKLSEDNYEKVTRDLCHRYLNSFSDRFSIVAYKLFYYFFKCANITNILFRKFKYKEYLENNITVRGDFNRIKRCADTSNVVYIASYKSLFDFLFINIAINRQSLPIPRFFVSSSIVVNRFQSMIIKLCGGYIIDNQKFVNPIYRELTKSYLSTLVEHGVPVLFFPELYVSKYGNIGKIKTEFLSSIMDSLLRNTEEIALFPIEILYYKRPVSLHDENSKQSVSFTASLDNIVELNFSEPILVSDFSSQEESILYMENLIKSRWISDSVIFPHYIFFSVLSENDYKLQISEAHEIINDFIKQNNIRTSSKPKQILMQGIDYIENTDIGEINNGTIKISRKDDSDYFLNLLHRSSKKIIQSGDTPS